VGGQLSIESVHPWATEEEVRAQTGFRLPDGGAALTVPPSDEELATLARVDSGRVRELEFA
jgi:hypothetical protein